MMQLIGSYLITFYNIYNRSSNMAPPNWDDDFDFDDLDDQPKKKQPQKKNKANNDDFFDLDDDSNKNKLPSINRNSGYGKGLTDQRNSAKKNPYTQNIKQRKNVYDDYDEDIDEEVEAPKKQQKKDKKKEVEEQVQFYEEIGDNEKENKKAEDDDEENYEEQFEQDNYGEDFEQIEQEKPIIKNQPPKKVEKQQNKKENVPKYQPPKPPERNSKINPNPAKRNQTLNKPVSKPVLPRSNSRQSLNSQNSRRNAANRSNKPNKFATNTSFIPNKYTSQIQKNFPSQNLNDFSQDKISKLNDRVRAMIKRFNDELNDLINRNLLHLKNKKNDKQITVEGRMKVLEEEKKNNQTMIEYMEKEFEKLCGREGQLKQQEYQLIMEKRINETKDKIKQTQKLITRLKVQVNSQGNKLSKKAEEKKIAQQLHHLKTTLIQAKKEDEKGTEKVEKLTEQIEDLNSKLSDVDYELKEVIDKAKEKGIQLESRQELIKKFEETKKKLQNSKNHRTKLEGLMKTKSERLNQEKQLLRQNVHHCQIQIKNLYKSIGHSRNESVKVVEKAKTNPKINPNIGEQLDKILQTLEQNQYDDFSVRSESNKSQASQRPLKNLGGIGNIEKSQPLKPTDSVKKTESDEVRLQKPNLMKKKKDHAEEEQKKNQVYQRVWKEEEKIEHKQEIKKEQDKKEEDKKKPFSLKKNRLSSENKLKVNKDDSKNEISNGLILEDQKKELAQNKQEEKKKEQISLAGPKMMKFKRRNQAEEPKEQIKKQEPKKQETSPKQELKLNLGDDKNKNEEEQKPAFVPKRFNLRNRAEKKENSYIPTDKKDEPVKESINIEKKNQEKNDEYKPNFNFNKVEDDYKKPEIKTEVKKDQSAKKFTIPPAQEKKQQQDKKEEEFKPKFNLRLRDRKKNEDTGGYQPSGNIEKVDSKKELNLNKNEIEDKSKPNENAYDPFAPKENNSNPYAPKQNSNPPNNNPYAGGNIQAPQRQRQGRVKKPKIEKTGSKQPINYFQQAEEAEGLNQFVKSPVNEPKEEKKQQEPQKDLDLNDLLNMNKETKQKKVNNDFDDILSGNQNKKAKKKNDFFDELDI